MPSITQYPKAHSHLKTQRAEHWNMFAGPQREQCLCPLFGQTFVLARNAANKAAKVHGIKPHNLHMIYADPSAFFEFYLKHNSSVLVTDCTLNYKKPLHVPKPKLAFQDFCYLMPEYQGNLLDTMRWIKPNMLADNYTLAALENWFNPPKPVRPKPGLDYWFVDLKFPAISFSTDKGQPQNQNIRLTGFTEADYPHVLHAALRSIVGNYLTNFAQVWELTPPHPRYLHLLKVVFSLPFE